MRKGEYEMNRMSRGSSLFRQDIQTQLLNSLKSKDIRPFKKIVLSKNADLNYFYEYPEYKTPLDIACSQAGLSEFAKLLVENGADINKVNPTHKRVPLHFAVETGDINTVQVLLEDENININTLSKGNTALNLVIKHIEDIDDERETTIKKFEKIVELLVKADIDVNIPDLKNITPIYSAAKQGLENIVEIILEHSSKDIDVDSYKDRRQKSARDIIKQSFPHLLDKIPSESKERRIEIDIHKLFSFLSAQDEEKFVAGLENMKKYGDLPKALVDNNGLYTLLQFACNCGLDKATEALLKHGADPNLSSPGNSTTPVVLTCMGGFHKILKQLVDNESTNLRPVNKESLLQIVIKEGEKDVIVPNSDYGECLKILLDCKQIISNINFADVKYNTALHYAARNGNQENVLKLLRKGASIGVRNSFDEPALADISPKTLEMFLDECLDTNKERPTDDDFEILFDYNFLVPRTYNSDNEACVIPFIDDSNVSINSNDDRLLAPETDALLYMSQNEDLRPLLAHPIITSFLFLKWQRISCLFYLNITFYFVFWLSLITYVVIGYVTRQQQSDFEIAIANTSYVLAVIGLILLVTREFIQLIVSPLRYLKSFENWIEMCLICVAAAIVIKSDVSEATKQQLSPVAILLSSAELVMLIGHFPNLSTYIVMLKTVSWNFFKFLLWYFILIIAFSLSFYTLFRIIEDNDDVNEKVAFDPNNLNKEDEDPKFFQAPGTSLFKTIVMLTGEFDAASIDFEAFPVTSHIIFVIFVFMIPIVLFNLLNGLAVSDTQAIKSDAELVGHVTRIEMISYFEHIFLGDTKLYRNVISKAQNSCCWLPGQSCVGNRIRIFNPLARRICLFPNVLPKARIGVKVNQNRKVDIILSETMKKKNRTNDENPQLVLCCLKSCNEIEMDKKVTKAAKVLIHNRRNNENLNLEKLQKQILSCEEKIGSYEKVLNSIYESVKK